MGGEALYVGVNAAITLAITLLSWHLLEKRALAFKSHFAYAQPMPAKGPQRKSPGGRRRGNR